MVEIGLRAILIKARKKTFFTFRSKSVSDGIQFRFENRENGIGVSVSVWDRKNPIRAFERRRRSPGKSLPTGSAFSAARPSVSAAKNLPIVRSFSIEGVSVQDLLSDWIQPEHRRTAPWLLRANVTVT